MNKARDFDQSVVTELKALLGERVSTSAAVREHHGKDESYFPYALPDAVVFPHSTEEVRDVVDICRRHRVPMIPFGVGTSLEGHILAVNGGVTIDLSRMNHVLAIHEEDLDAVVQAGVTRKQLNEHIKHTGLFFPIDPGADATLGGMTATRASGTNAVRYGTMRENVLSLKVVLPDGRIIQTSRRAKKSAAGYDLTRLMIGSEGTLGIITEVTVRLYPVQEAMSAAVCAFDSVDGCTRTVIATIQSGIPLARGVDRRLRADLAPCRMRARDDGGREELLRAGAAPRAHRRRQLPPDAAGRSGEAAGDRDRQDIQQAPGRARAAHGRHLHRRARHRHGQDGLDAPGAGRRCHRRDARHQAHARSGQPAEPGQGRSTAMSARAIFGALLAATLLPAA